MRMSNFHYSFFCLRGGDSSRVGGVLSELIDLKLVEISARESVVSVFLQQELRDDSYIENAMTGE